MSTLRQRHSGPSIVVPARRLSEFISTDIDLLKIDIEGAEREVLNDLATTGKLRNVRRLHLEYHHHIDASEDNLSSVLGLMEENGFGYQLRADVHQWPAEEQRSGGRQWPTEASFQDISIYCYQK